MTEPMRFCIPCGYAHTDAYASCKRRAVEIVPSGPPSLFDPPGPPVGGFNAEGSPTGRVMGHAPMTSVAAAVTTDARGHRTIAYNALVEAGSEGLTSREIARLLPVDRDGHPQNSNRCATRLGELWEERRATVQRSGGVCVIGRCHPHAKPNLIHRPQERCLVHGEPVKRDGAAVWLALRDEVPA